MQNKNNSFILMIFVLSILISITAAGCKSFEIPEQKDPSLSLMVLKLNTPNEYEIKEADIIGNDKVYSRTSWKGNRTKDNRQLQIYNNIPGGKYRLEHLYAETVKIQNEKTTEWKQLNLKFIDTGNRTTENNQWLELKPGSINYAGCIDYVTVDRKDEVLTTLGKIFKKTPQEVNKSVISEFEMISDKDKIHCIFIRLDHPALIGQLESLQNEKEVWQVILNTKREKPSPAWDQLMKNRIVEIDKEIALLSVKNKR